MKEYPIKIKGVDMTFKAITTAIVTATILFGGAAHADSIFQRGAQNFDTNISLDLVRASSDGTVKVYNYHGGERGDLLGMTDVHAGANTDVKIKIRTTSSDELLAVLSVDGFEAAVEDLNEASN